MLEKASLDEFEGTISIFFYLGWEYLEKEICQRWWWSCVLEWQLCVSLITVIKEHTEKKATNVNMLDVLWWQCSYTTYEMCIRSTTFTAYCMKIINACVKNGKYFCTWYSIPWLTYNFIHVCIISHVLNIVYMLLG